MEKLGSLIDLKSDLHYEALCQYKGGEYVAHSDKNDILICEHIKIRINFHKYYVLSNMFSTAFLLNM